MRKIKCITVRMTILYKYGLLLFRKSPVWPNELIDISSWYINPID